MGELRAAGHDVVWSGDWEDDPGDEAILAKAHAQHRILVTLIRTLANSQSSVVSRTAVLSGWSIFPRGDRRRCVCEYSTPTVPNWNPAP